MWFFFIIICHINWSVFYCQKYIVFVNWCTERKLSPVYLPIVTECLTPARLYIYSHETLCLRRFPGKQIIFSHLNIAHIATFEAYCIHNRFSVLPLGESYCHYLFQDGRYKHLFWFHSTHLGSETCIFILDLSYITPLWDFLWNKETNCLPLLTIAS